jgi:hypothetical protein
VSAAQRSNLIVEALRRLADDLEKRPLRGASDYRVCPVFAAVLHGGTPEAELNPGEVEYLARLGVPRELYAAANAEH